MVELISYNLQNKLQIARAIALIYDVKNSIPDYLKVRLLESLLWAVTEHNDDGQSKKYIGQPYWSLGAIQRLRNNNENRTLNKTHNIYFGLRHEHSIPKKTIAKLILDSDRSESSILQILNNLGHAVIVSLEEDAMLNKNGLRAKTRTTPETNSRINNVFSRYKEVGIKVCDIRDKAFSDLLTVDISELERNSLT